MKEVVYKPIGVVHSPFKAPQDVMGYVEVTREYVEGLRDVDGFSHLILIYHCHLAQDYSLLVRPFLDKRLHGVFSTRAPSRPNPVGVSVVRLTRMEKNVLHIQDVDIIDGTPLLDIKPFVPDFDQRKAERIGWLTGKVDKMHSGRDDGRFAKNTRL
jgi:tRNA-Thr(GGU) m(6)t(6)A37 methyltransferase TsaA